MTVSKATQVRLIVVFAVALSLASLPGPMSSNFHLPSIGTASGIPECHYPIVQCHPSGSNDWVPAGPAEDTLVATIFTDETAEFLDIQSSTPHIDFTDYPLTPDLTGPFTASNNLVITSTIQEAGYFEIQFMLANNFWGCDFHFGNSTCGVNVRQGIWHMIDTSKFAAFEPSITGQAVALDTPVPSDNVGGLVSPNPCGWDNMFPESGANCAAGAPGGTAYHLSNATGANGVPWLQAPGSKDLDAAAAHFVAAGIATGCDGGTGIASCIASADSKLSGISPAALSHAIIPFIENENPPRLRLGDSIAEQICYIFTGSYNFPCPYVIVTLGPITAFPGLTTSTTSVNRSWYIYTAAYESPLGPSPFDHSLYFQYNSRFVSGIPPIQAPNGLCSSSSVPTTSAPDYMYLCDPTYDGLTNQMEFAPCLTVSGDPVVGSQSNVSTGTCPNSGGQLSAVGAGVQAEDRFGKNAYTIPVFEQNDQFGYLNNGWIRDINNVGSGLPNYFTWLDAWNNPSNAGIQGFTPGTIRQGFKQTTTSASPFIDTTIWDSYIVHNIYDSLAIPNPVSGGQLIDWMVISISQAPNLALSYIPPPGTTTSLRFTLRSDMFFQDGKSVTAFDVAFSYLALKGAGALAGVVAAPMTGITVLGPLQFDINLNASGPFTELSLTSLPILPGAFWSNAGSPAWTSAINTCTATGAPCYPAQYTINPSNPTTTNCALTCVFPAGNMNVNVVQTSAFYDPVANHSLVGSGPWQCGSVTDSGSSLCSPCSPACQNVPVGGSWTLTRFGKGLAPGSSVSSIYFRSNGNLALWIWSQDNGDITHDFLNFSVVASCFGAPITSSPPCAHFQQGVGDICTLGNSCAPQLVRLAQISIVMRFVGVNWVAPFNWVSNPPFGVIPLDPVLYEGATIINPSSVVGCPNGYDC